jgi:hypothetical protein
LSSKISRAIKKAGSYKGMSFLKFVPYTMSEFKFHLESLFEPWMTWDNHGPYKANVWDDNNPSTWTWSIDHIIPQSDLPYSSMEEKNFKKCWSLSNLRPLNAKRNLMEGIQGIRHSKQI